MPGLAIAMPMLCLENEMFRLFFTDFPLGRDYSISIAICNIVHTEIACPAFNYVRDRLLPSFDLFH